VERDGGDDQRHAGALDPRRHLAQDDDADDVAVAGTVETISE
jgi:hypothetical protein